MIKLAVILAAGLGSRLKHHTKEMPKGFMKVGDKPIVVESIDALLAAGIEQIIIGTGYLSEQYEQLSQNYPEGVITCVQNPEYASTGSMGTLAAIQGVVKDDFLLLESDLVYDCSGLDILLNHEQKNVILASGKTDSCDEVYIESGEDHRLVNISKNAKEIQRISGELTGLNRISYPLFLSMAAYYDEHKITAPKLDYEITMSKIAHSETIFVEKKDDFLWCEIDDESHLKRAKETIYPNIRSRS